MNPSSCIFGKTSAVRQFHFNSRFFFYFVTWISFNCLEIFDGIQNYFDMKNLKILGRIPETRK